MEVELLLPHAVLVPEQLFRPELAADLLAANGTPLARNEVAVACEARNGSIALVAADAVIHRQVTERFPHARFVTPLETVPQNTEKCVWICRKANLLYTKVYCDGVLRLAEVLPIVSEAEIGYFIGRLGRIFPLAEYELRITGEEPRTLRKWIGKEFGKVLCE